MMDIVARLRDVAGFIQKEWGRVAAAGCLATEAADTIEELQAALEPFANLTIDGEDSLLSRDKYPRLVGHIEQARRVLRR